MFWPGTATAAEYRLHHGGRHGLRRRRCYGRPDLKTPNIDRIAAKGVRFLQGYANSAVCTATRTALITGRYQYRLRLGLEEPLGTGNADVGLPPEHPTLPSLLKKAGYRTTLVGKWHLGACRTTVRSRAATTISTDSAAARIDYYRTRAPTTNPTSGTTTADREGRVR